MTKIIINILLFLAVIGLGIYLVVIVREPILREARWERIEDARVERLEYIREAQKAYREVTGHFAQDWADLVRVLKTDSFTLVRTIGDPHAADTTMTIQRDTSRVAIRDSIFPAGFDIANLPYIPMSEKNAQWQLAADTVSRGGVQVQVFQVTDTDPFRPNQILRVGSLTEATYAGNWE